MPDNHGVYLVPAFVGLGAPYWDADARGAIYRPDAAMRPPPTSPAPRWRRSPTRPTTWSTAMVADGGAAPATLRVDGGMARERLALPVPRRHRSMSPVERPANLETTALGAAFHAGLATGVWTDLDALARTWVPSRALRSGNDSRTSHGPHRRLAGRG